MDWLGRLFGGKPGAVESVRKYKGYGKGSWAPFMCTYELYRAETEQDAREFLEGIYVCHSHYYFVVETPEGNWAKVITGIRAFDNA